MADKLTAKQKAFVDHYIKSFNGGEAAVQAGYSERSRYEIAYDLLRLPQIQDAIRQRTEHTAMSADEWLSLTAEIARGDMQDFLDIRSMTNEVDLFKALEAGKTRLLKSVKVRTTTKVGKGGEEEEQHILEIELYDRLSALDKLGRHLGLLSDRHTVTLEASPDVQKLLDKVWPDDSSNTTE